jgi:hypothetical protein
MAARHQRWALIGSRHCFDCDRCPEELFSTPFADVVCRRGELISFPVHNGL